MLESIGELLLTLLDIFLFFPRSKKKRIKKSNEIISEWSKQFGLLQYNKYNAEEANSYTAVDESGNSFQIWIQRIDSNRFIIRASVNKSKQSKTWKKNATYPA